MDRRFPPRTVIAAKSLLMGAVLLMLLPLPAACLAREPVTLQLRWDHSYQFAGYYAAKWQGYYDEAGLDVHIRSALAKDGALRTATEEVAAGRADFGIGAADILLARDAGAPLVLLATIFHQSAVAFYALEGAGMRTPADLVNLRVSRRLRDMTDVELQAMLMAEGIEPALVEAYPFDPSEGFLAAMAEGRVDVIPGYSIGTPFDAKTMGLDVTSLNPADYGVDFYGDSLFTRRELVETRPDMVQAFTEASIRGWEYALEHPEEVASRIIREFTPRFPISDYAGFVRYQTGPVHELTMHPIVEIGSMNPERWRQMFRTLKKVGLVEGAFDAEAAIFDPERMEERRNERLATILGVVTGVLVLAGLVSLVWIGFLLRSIRRRKQVEARLRQRTQDLRERVKELRGIYGITALAEKPDLTLEEILNEAVFLIPPAWQYPGITRARIVLEGTSYTSMDFKEGPWSLSQPLLVNGVKVGKVEVFYLEERPQHHTGPFLEEEVHLLQALAQRLGEIIERVRREQKLRRDEALLSKMGRMAKVGGWEVDLGTGRQVWTEETYRIHDLDFEYQPTLEKGISFFIPEHQQTIESAINRCASEGQPYDLELQLVTSSERTVWVRTQGEPLYEDGRIHKIWGTVQDITQHRQILAGIRESEQKFRSLYDSIRDAILMADPQRTIIDCNPAFRELFGYSPEELQGHKTASVYESEEEYRKLGERLRNEQPGFIMVVNYRKKSGEVFPGETSAFPLKNNQGEITGFVGLIRDASERQEAEQAIKEREERWRSLLQSIQAGVIVHAPDTEIIACNTAALELLQLSQEQLLGKTVYDPHWRFLREDGSAMPQEEYPVSVVLETGRPVRNCTMGLHLPQREEPVWALVHADPVFSEEGELQEIIDTFMDISDFRKAQQQIRSLARFPSENPAPVLRVDRHRKLVFANEGSRTLLQCLDMEVGDRLAPELRELVQPALEQHVSYTRDMEVNDIMYSMTVTAIAGQDYVNIYGQDITDRKQAEEELLYHRMLLQRTFESLEEAVFIVEDDTFVIIDCNPAALMMLGYDRAELVGQSADKLHVNPKYREDFRERIRKEVAEQGYMHLPEFFLQRKTGEVFITEHYVMPLDDDSGKRLAWVSVVRDITEKRKAEEKLKQHSYELEVLQELSRKLGYTLDFADMIKLMLEYLPSVIACDVAAGMLVREGRAEIYDLSSVCIGEELQQDIARRMYSVLERFNPDSELPPLQVFREVTCALSDKNEPIEKLGSSFLVPLLEGHEAAAGVLFIGAQKPDVFSADQVGILFKVAEEASNSVSRLRQLVEEHRQELAQLVRSLPLGVVLLDAQHQVVMANPWGEHELQTLGGVKAGEVLEQLGELSLQQIIEAQQGGEHAGPLHTSDHDSSIYEISTSPLRKGPQAGGLVLVIRDVTEEQRAAERIKASERKFRTLFDNSSDAIFVHDLQGRILDVNKVACMRLEYGRDELVGSSLRDLAPSDCADEARMRRRIEALEEKGFIFFETVQQRKSGESIPTEVNAKLVEYQGEPAVLANARNITERKEAERERFEHEAMLDAILSGIKAAFFIVNPQNLKVVEANEQAATLLRRPLAEILDSTCHEILELDICNYPECKECKKSETSFLDQEVLLSLGDGEAVPVSLSRLHLQKGGEPCIAIILFDITEQKSLERQLAYAQKLESVGQLAAGIAHEINTPIQYVAGNISFFQTAFDKLKAVLEAYAALQRAVEQEHEDADGVLAQVQDAVKKAKLQFLLTEIPEAIADSEDGVERVTSIVQAMKKFSHPDVEERKSLDVNEAVQNTITVARNEWKYDSELQTDLAEGLPPIVCVPGDFNQAVLNVLVNAAHANSAAYAGSGKKGTITVATRQVQQAVEISISDSGKGIPKEYQNRIFDPFFTTKEVGKGTGQGLAITFAIMEKHGGSIDFTTRPERGTTFVLRFPLEPPQKS